MRTKEIIALDTWMLVGTHEFGNPIDCLKRKMKLDSTTTLAFGTRDILGRKAGMGKLNEIDTEASTGQFVPVILLFQPGGLI
ncbi:hypothetical protein [uncultured Sphaerochaeta sp.]|uniref:hypothetical protein n=1 Tax=uncultured Sphaerochaeta sp. TaxID=886478 RepID=UPI002A0A80F3|nr:hypothetical protein [uncultured Sphaerochaeta sp.]